MPLSSSFFSKLNPSSSNEGHSTKPSFASDTFRSPKVTGTPNSRLFLEILNLTWRENTYRKVYEVTLKDKFYLKNFPFLTLGLFSITFSSSTSTSLPSDCHGCGVLGNFLSVRIRSSPSPSSASPSCASSWGGWE